MYRLKTYFLIFFCFFLCLVDNFGQGAELDIPYDGQKAPLWCWASSMEMIMNYYQPQNNISQCSIANTHFFRENQTGYMPSGAPPNQDCEKLCNDPNYIWTDYYNVPLSYNKNYMFSDYTASYFDIIFSDLGYNSNEDMNILNFDEYRAEIDKCRPMILAYKIGNDTINSFPHAVVGKGYYKMPNPNNDLFLLINDPLIECVGKQYLLNSYVLNGLIGNATSGTDIGYEPLTEDIYTSKTQLMVHHILPKNVPCDTCFKDKIPLSKARNINKNELISAIEKNQKEFIGTNLSGEVSFEKIKQYEGTHTIKKIYYISPPRLKAASKNPSWNKVILPTNAYEVIYNETNPKLKTIYHCNKSGENCVAEKIEFEDDPFEKTVQVENTKITISKYGKSIDGQNSISYEVVKFLPYSIEFYRIIYKGKPYLIPKDRASRNFFYDKDQQEKLVAITEDKILEGLVLYVQNYNYTGEGRRKKEVNRIKRKSQKFKKRLNKKIY